MADHQQVFRLLRRDGRRSVVDRRVLRLSLLHLGGSIGDQLFPLRAVSLRHLDLAFRLGEIVLRTFELLFAIALLLVATLYKLLAALHIALTVGPSGASVRNGLPAGRN